MWDSDKQQRLDSLQQQAQRAPLAADEQQVLDRLILELEQAEWETLRPALGQFHGEQANIQASLGYVQTQNALLAALAARYADLLARTKRQLDSLVRERDMLRTEYERALKEVVRP